MREWAKWPDLTLRLNNGLTLVEQRKSVGVGGISRSKP